MTQLFSRCYLVFAAVLFCSAVSAQTFNYSVSCRATTLGPVNVDFAGSTGSGSVMLVPNVRSTGWNILSIGVSDQSYSSTVTTGNFNDTSEAVVGFITIIPGLALDTAL